MSAISVYLERLRSALFGEDVRGAIIGAITECYDNVNDPRLRTDALEAALQHKIDQGEMAALTIGDGTITGATLHSTRIQRLIQRQQMQSRTRQLRSISRFQRRRLRPLQGFLIKEEYYDFTCRYKQINWNN